jgi:hypothetical protein
MTPITSLHQTLLAHWPYARGEALHRAALEASHAGEHRVAERLFTAAGRAYRRELELLPLARLRVHQLIARAEADAGPEIERRLERLEDIESPIPPFELVPAASLRTSLPEAGVAPESEDITRAA